MQPFTKRARVLILLAIIFIPYWIGKISFLIEKDDFFLIIWVVGVMFIVGAIGTGMLLKIVYQFLRTGKI